MSGHSKWANIKRRKGAVDAKRGKIFTKLVREITTAARTGGPDRNANPRLRAAIAAAKSGSMPAENIERAIKKGSGDLAGPPPEDGSYEGYGPGGVAFLVEVQTDNRNRTGSEVRAAFTKAGGNLGAPGSVAWMFTKRGVFAFPTTAYSEEVLFELSIEQGAEEIRSENNMVIVECAPEAFDALLTLFDDREMIYESAELTMVPDNVTAVTGDEAAAVMKLVERLEDLEDVQKVHANFDIDTEELERLL
jgi:YebC/PmpR family DNA-binding regulatory protein